MEKLRTACPIGVSSLLTLAALAASSCGSGGTAPKVTSSGAATFGNGQITVNAVSVEGNTAKVKFSVESGVKDLKIFVHAFPANKEDLPAGKDFLAWDHYPQTPLSKMTPRQTYEDVFPIPVKEPKRMRLQIGFFDESTPPWLPVARDSSSDPFVEIVVQ